MKRLTTEIWLERAKATHGDTYDYSESSYVNMRTLIAIRCRVHGVFHQLPYDHINGHGCPDCGFESTRGSKSNSKGKGATYSIVYGVGINDILHDDTPHIQRVWRSMLLRCYNAKHHAANPSYKGCSVCKEWLIYSAFKKWYLDPSNGYKEGYQLDKDIMVRGNKVYSPETCSFVPRAINCFFGHNPKKKSGLPLGVFMDNGKIIARFTCGGKDYEKRHFTSVDEASEAYKRAKEAALKEVATLYYGRGEITKRVYDALMRYKV